MALDRIDLLILKALALAPLHGYGIGQRIEQMSGGVFRITLGALYPALQRLERNGHGQGRVVHLGQQPSRARRGLTASGRRRLATGQKSGGSGRRGGHDARPARRHGVSRWNALWRRILECSGRGTARPRGRRRAPSHHVDLLVESETCPPASDPHRSAPAGAKPRLAPWASARERLAEGRSRISARSTRDARGQVCGARPKALPRHHAALRRDHGRGHWGQHHPLRAGQRASSCDRCPIRRPIASFAFSTPIRRLASSAPPWPSATSTTGGGAWPALSTASVAYYVMGRTVSVGGADADVVMTAQVSRWISSTSAASRPAGSSVHGGRNPPRAFNSALAPVGPDPVVMLSHDI